MTRANLAAYLAMVAACEVTVDNESVEVLVDGEYEEITFFPGEAFSDEYEDGVEMDWSKLNDFPEIRDALERSLGFAQEHASNDKAVRRAESGYAQ